VYATIGHLEKYKDDDKLTDMRLFCWRMSNLSHLVNITNIIKLFIL